MREAMAEEGGYEGGEVGNGTLVHAMMHLN